MKKRSKSQAYILDTIRDHGECYVGWSYTYGQRIRDAAYALQDEGLIVVMDKRRFSNGRVSAIARAA